MSSTSAAADSGRSASPLATSSLREEGNSFFKSGNYLKAAACYTQALKKEPENHALYSNRSAAFLHLSKVNKALADAEKTVELKADWDKGYFRKGCALEALQRHEEAMDAFKKAGELNPQSKEVSQKLRALTRLVRDQKRGRTENSGNGDANRSGNPQQPTEPSDEELRVESFRKDILLTASAAMENSDPSFEPSFTLLEGKRDENGKERLSKVAIKEAFDSLDTLTNCVVFLRQHSADISPIAGVLVAPRRHVAFPQVWNGLGARHWRHGDKNGFFLQLEHSKRRKIWFLPLGENGKMEPAEELDIDHFALLAPIFR